MSFEGGPVNLITEINGTDNDLTLYKSKQEAKVRDTGTLAVDEWAWTLLFTLAIGEWAWFFCFLLLTQEIKKELI